MRDGVRGPEKEGKKGEKGKKRPTLDELCRVCDYHRKYAHPAPPWSAPGG